MTPPQDADGDLERQAAIADARLALYRRRVDLGRGDSTKLAELERLSAGAHERARRARRADADTSTEPKDAR